MRFGFAFSSASDTVIPSAPTVIRIPSGLDLFGYVDAKFQFSAEYCVAENVIAFLAQRIYIIFATFLSVVIEIETRLLFVDGRIIPFVILFDWV